MISDTNFAKKNCHFSATDYTKENRDTLVRVANSIARKKGWIGNNEVLQFASNVTPMIRNLHIEFQYSSDSICTYIVTCVTLNQGSGTFYFGRGQSKFGAYLYSCRGIAGDESVCHGVENVNGPL